MPQLRYFTAGESHGQCLIGVLEGLPAGLKLDLEAVNRDLVRRQKGYGRGGTHEAGNRYRRNSHRDAPRRNDGSPLTLLVKNRGFQNQRIARRDQTPTRPRRFDGGDQVRP